MKRVGEERGGEERKRVGKRRIREWDRGERKKKEKGRGGVGKRR